MFILDYSGKKRRYIVYESKEAIDYFQISLLPQTNFVQKCFGLKERWGEFSWEQQYAIYEDVDLQILKKLIG